MSYGLLRRTLIVVGRIIGWRIIAVFDVVNIRFCLFALHPTFIHVVHHLIGFFKKVLKRRLHITNNRERFLRQRLKINEGFGLEFCLLRNHACAFRKPNDEAVKHRKKKR